ncbi:MAG: Tim44 domain-containing protein [Deltaproteobacteria bacterium]|nr:Tim44 domain-containing protein [Deltaproteobacteria bacterium]
MLNKTSSIKLKTLLVLLFAVFVVLGLSDLADARSSSGGRSMGGSRSGVASSPSKSFGNPSSPSGSGSFSPSSPLSGGGGSSFLRGVGGGIVGGMIGNMLFGGSGHAGGSGGVGSSGIGIFELLILGGLVLFLYKRFVKPQIARNPSVGSVQSPSEGRVWVDRILGRFNKPKDSQRPVSPPYNSFSTGNFPPADFQPPSAPPLMASASPETGFNLIKQSEPNFDPEQFKEIAQDIFFKVQAAWMRRDTSSVQGLIGKQIKAEYDVQFADLRRKGLINRLENIAVRSIAIVDMGMEGQEEYINVLFTANLLDYTVEESSGRVVKGDNTDPVKFEEFWTFARPVDSTLWKLEGIKVK